MDNEKIPDEIWDLKNEILRRMQEVTSNNYHMDYKHLWRDFAQVAQSSGAKIEKLINQYQQPKED